MARHLAASTLAAILVACAGSISWDRPDPEELNLLPGGSGQATATLHVEGSYTGRYAIAVSTDEDGVTATVEPTSAEMGGEPMDFLIRVETDPGVTAETAGVQITATDEGGDHFAATTLIVRIEQP